MTTKIQLQNKIQELEEELQQFKQQLNDYKEHPTIQEANVGDVLADGSIVLQKSNGLALLVAPKNTEVEAKWSKEFPEVFRELEEQGFNPSQWFVPTQEQLKVAYDNPNTRKHFFAAFYWSSTETNSIGACVQNFGNGSIGTSRKPFSDRVRAFRCVTY